MKLMTLNIWGGHIYEPLLQFIKAHQEIDIFCLQEVYHNASHKISTDNRKVYLTIFSDLHSMLPKHNAFFRATVKDMYGIGIFAKKTLDVLGEGEILIHDNLEYSGFGPTHSRNLQWLKYKHEKQIYFIFNVHGLWNGKGKTDSIERISQSQKIRNFIHTTNSRKILCGDFNVRPDTKSMEILEQGMNNLIKDYKVSATRTSLYEKEERFADYVLVTPNIIINNFEVLKDEVSDHSPLLLDFS
jgi:endonuclease/exonuclease/phosphatase family metal-dependent hydrolase